MGLHQETSMDEGNFKGSQGFTFFQEAVLSPFFKHYFDKLANEEGIIAADLMVAGLAPWLPENEEIMEAIKDIDRDKGTTIKDLIKIASKISESLHSNSLLTPQKTRAKWRDGYVLSTLCEELETIERARERSANMADVSTSERDSK